jgi:hypothetical protein
MKGAAYKIRQEDLRPLLEETLKAVLADTSWDVVAVRHKPYGDGLRIDAEVQVKSGGRTLSLEVGIIAELRVSQVREMVRRDAQQTRLERSPNTQPLLFVAEAPHSLAQELRESGTNYFDLYGGAYLRWPGLHLERLPRHEPLAPGARELKAREPQKGRPIHTAGLFGTRPVRRHRVLRALLSYPGRRWHQHELAAEVAVDSSSQVHDIIRYLQREGLVDSEGAGPRKVVFLTRPGDLLERWSLYWEESWREATRKAGQYYTLNLDPGRVMAELAAVSVQTGGKVGFTLAAGANLFRPLLRDETVHAWVVGEFAPIARAANLEAVPRNPNVILLPARDEGVLYLPANAREKIGQQLLESTRPVSPVQLYLDMRAAGGRYAEQAATLRQEVLGY